MTDITPKFTIIPSAEIPGGISNISNDPTVVTPAGTMVQPKKDTSIGGMQAGATTLTQGSGNDIFKISSKGVHLGAANFEDAPFSVDMQGNVVATTLATTELHIPDTVTANSFHVDTSGNTWWGSTVIGSAVAKILNTGAATFTSGTIGGFTITSTALYGGIIKTAATVGAGTTGVIMDTAGLRGYDSVLGNTFNLPTDGSAPTFASGIINSTIFNINTNAILRTSTTVGDGGASSHGILINDTGFYACEDNQLTSAANVRILTDGSGYFSGTFEIGGATKTIDAIGNLQTALNDVSAAGGGTVYLKSGTYTLTANITIPGGVTLEGVNRDGVILDGDSSYAVKIIGTNTYTTGSITISNGDTTVVGSGTTFTAGMVGRFIYLNGLWYEIVTFTDTTHIEISPAYVGPNLSGYAYAIADTNFNAIIRKLTIQNATGSGFIVQYANEPWIDDLVITGCGTGIDIDYCVFPKLFVLSESNGVNLNMNYVSGFKIDYSSLSFSTTGAGIVMTKVLSSTCIDTAIDECTGDGINMTDCDQIAFISNSMSNNGGQGIEFVSGVNDCQIVACVADGNTSDGIKFTATSDRNTIVSSSIINNGGYGINIAASTCDNNQIIAPAFDNNTSGNINDSGTNTFVSPENQDLFTAGENISVSNPVSIIAPNTHSIDLEKDSSQYLSFGDSTSTSITGSFTFECWVKIESLATNGTLIGKGRTSGANTASYLIYVDTSGNISVNFSTAGVAWTTMSFATSLSTGTNYHIAVVYNSGVNTKVYKNGTLVSTDATFTGAIYDNSEEGTIGRDDTNGGQYYYDGLIDDVRLWSVVRTAEQISGCMNIPLIGNETGLKAYWKLDNALTDSTSNGNTLTNNNSAVFSSTILFGSASPTIRISNSDSESSAQGFIGFSTSTVTTSNSTNVRFNGKILGLTSLIPGRKYYVNGAGTLSTTAGTNTILVGKSLSSTSLLIINS